MTLPAANLTTLNALGAGGEVRRIDGAMAFVAILVGVCSRQTSTPPPYLSQLPISSTTPSQTGSTVTGVCLPGLQHRRLVLRYLCVWVRSGIRKRAQRDADLRRELGVSGGAADAGSPPKQQLFSRHAALHGDDGAAVCNAVLLR